VTFRTGTIKRFGTGRILKRCVGGTLYAQLAIRIEIALLLNGASYIKNFR